MTYQQIADQANQELDQYRIPFNDSTQTAALLYRAITNFVEKTYKRFELDEQAREDLAALVQPFNPPAGRIINTDSLSSFMYVTSLAGIFTDPCNASATITRRIRPVKLDKLNVILYEDVMEQPTVYYPVYVTINNGTNNTIVVYADSTGTISPVGYTNATYLTLPPQPNPALLSSTSPTLRVQAHMAIAEEFKLVVMEQIDDFNRIPQAEETIADRGQ